MPTEIGLFHLWGNARHPTFQRAKGRNQSHPEFDSSRDFFLAMIDDSVVELR